MKKFASLLAFLILSSSLPAQTEAPAKQLTIEAIFAEGGLTGREPENIQWSPDSSKVSYVQRDDAGEHGELWYVDTATGEKKVLVSGICTCPPSDNAPNKRSASLSLAAVMDSAKP